MYTCTSINISVLERILSLILLLNYKPFLCILKTLLAVSYKIKFKDEITKNNAA